MMIHHALADERLFCVHAGTDFGDHAARFVTADNRIAIAA
jgi:hypothetical protein